MAQRAANYGHATYSNREQFHSNNHPGWVSYKPHRDGGMLFVATRSLVQLIATYPNEMPWAADKTHKRPWWKRSRGVGRIGFRVIAENAERLHTWQTEQKRQGRESKRRPRLESYAAFLAHCDPAHVRAVSGYNRGAFPLYCALRRCPGILELLGDDPDPEGLAGSGAIAYALSEVGFFAPERRRRQLEYARRLLPRKRRDILIALGFPAEHAGLAVNVLGKMPRSSVNLFTLRAIRDFLLYSEPPVLKLLAHCVRINTPVLELLCESSVLRTLTPSLLAEVGTLANDDASASRIVGTLRDVRDLVALRRGHQPIVRSLEALDALHEAEVLRSGRVPFPTADSDLGPPPLPEIPGVIEYVSHSISELRVEGTTMSNCVAGYGERVARGECFIYRVLSPERCTLSIVPRTDGRFSIAELKGPQNSPASDMAYREVDSWLRLAPDIPAEVQKRIAEMQCVRWDPLTMDQPFVNALYDRPLFKEPYCGDPDFAPDREDFLGFPWR